MTTTTKLKEIAVAKLLRRMDEMEQRLARIESERADPSARREMRELRAHLEAFLALHSKSPQS